MSSDEIVSARIVPRPEKATFILVTLRAGGQRWQGCQMTNEQAAQAAERLAADPKVKEFRIVTAASTISGGNTTAAEMDPERIIEGMRALVEATTEQQEQSDERKEALSGG